MDWYLFGRILGVVFWPAAAAVVLYGIGWFAAMPRPPHVADNIKRWSRLAAVLGFFATLFFTARDLLQYTGVMT